MKNGWITSDFGHKHHYVDGKLHSVNDEPAIILDDGTKIWRNYEKVHRINKPAIEYSDGSKTWVFDNVYYRLDGPAMEGIMYNSWYLGRPFSRARPGRISEKTYREKLKTYPIEFYTNYTDYVDLYINKYKLISPVESENKIRCPVIKYKHTEFGNIKDLALVPKDYGFILNSTYKHRQCNGVYLRKLS